MGLEAAPMKNTVAKVISDLGAIRIENLVGTEVPTNLIGLYPEDYSVDASHFICPAENQRLIKEKRDRRNAQCPEERKQRPQEQ